ncbi:MAG: tetratricopeptide repeat protein [Thermoguttaceae bacterium]
MGQRLKKHRPRKSSLIDCRENVATGPVNRLGSSSAAQVGMPYSQLVVCGLLLLAVIAVFGQTAGHDFINFDDDAYVYENLHVRGGLTGDGTAWAITARHSGNWHPLTWLSHMLDCQLYDLKPGGHHLTNVLLHAIAAVLLFLALQQMTAALWPSAWAAAVFAIHPLRVESVAWVAERKDVLSGVFFMLTVWLYARFVQRPASWGRYLLMAASFALGLTTKPMLVTLPFVLLLLDYWPLGRGQGAGSGERRAKSREQGAGSGEQRAGGASGAPACGSRVGEQAAGRGRNAGQSLADRGPKDDRLRILDFTSQVSGSCSRLPAPCSLLSLIVEKIPLFVLAAASCVVTLVSQHDVMKPLERLDFPWRVANAAVAYVAYLGKMLYPAGLAVFYPLPNTPPPAWEVVAAIAVLLAISTATFLSRRKCPYLLVGWLWYLGTLVPVIGLVQVGSQAMADRYTYLTQIGLYTACAWGVAQAAASWPYCRRSNRRWPLAAVSALVVAALMVCAWQQTGQWHDSEKLWQHTLACTSQNPIAHNSLGNALADCGRVDEAIGHYRQALEIESGYAPAHHNLGRALASRGQASEAITHYQQALTIKPDYAEAHNNLGYALISRGQVDEAITHYRQALAIKPDLAEAHNNLGNALAGRGQIDEAITCYRQALAVRPDFAEAHNNLGNALAGRGQIDEAIVQYQQALAIKPEYAEAQFNLGYALAGRGQVDEAIAQYQKALEVKPDYAEAQFNLGYALSGRGQVHEAITHYRKALAIKPDYAEVHYNLGYVLVGRGQVDEAIAHYRKAVEIKPNFAEAHTNLGNALAGRGQVAEAVAYFQKATEIEPNFVEAHTNLGCALASLGRIDEATAHYRRALAIKPDYAEAHFNLGHILAGHGEVDAAIAHYRKALETRPDYAEAHNNLGNELAGRGQVDEAIAHYQKALEIEPDNVRAHYNFGNALAGRGKLDEALEQYQKALSLASTQNDEAAADVIRARIKLQQSAPAGKSP